ncbi:NRDE-2, necessary for RNA interference-domain-containing protein [Halenospora varia]|nr:NRDE-2, necessary for RNA interference-domain-containing protein [Halenospora varia]
MSESKTTVPKFASFRPKPQPSKSSSPTEQQPERRRSPKSRSSARDEGDRRHHHRRRRENERPQKEAPLIARARSRSPEPTRDIFVIDRKGDEKNLIYGSIHRYSIPGFHRSGAGNVLGASTRAKIDRDASDDKGIVLLDWRENHPSYREKYAFSRVERQKPRLLRIKPEASAEPQHVRDSDFIPLDPTKGKKRKRTGTESSSGDDEFHYRSIHGKRKLKDQPEDDAFEYATNSDSAGDSALSTKLIAKSREKNIDLNRRVEEHPQDIDAWFALIQQQDILLHGDNDRRRITNAEMRSTADIKIHLFEKALGHVKSLKDRERLLLGLMAEGTKIWELKVQADRWEQIAKDNIDSLTLWKSYMNFRQATFTNFRYEEIRDLYVQRMKLLLRSLSASDSTTVVPLYQQLLYVLLRATIYIRESGYSELAIAIWQGLLEMNFCGPDQPHNREERTRQFSDFWEAEIPRIGEGDAKGWLSFLTGDQSAEAPEPVVDDAEGSLDNSVLFKSWAAAERARSESSFIPAKTMDEVVEDDPFRVILFSDIEDFMIALPPGSKDLQKTLLDSFLIFCRLPPIDSQCSGSRQDWLTDSFITGELLEWDPLVLKQEYLHVANDESGESKIASIFDIPVANHSESIEAMFSTSHRFRNAITWRSRFAGPNAPVSYKWLRNTLKMLVDSHFREDMAVYYLSFEWRNEPEGIKKVSKTLLKKHPASLELYNAYGMIEWSRGNKEIANSVFSAALGMRRTEDSEKTGNSIELWKSWVWASLEETDNHAALQRILSTTDGAIPADGSNNVSIANQLKTKQHLTSNRDYYLTSNEESVAILYAELLALLEYLTGSSSTETQSATQGDITSALAMYTSFSTTLSRRGPARPVAHEPFLQSAARLLYHHARIGPFRPALLREHLTNFIALFPQNTIFLSLYTWNESRLRIDNRVRNILQSTVLTPDHDTPTSRLFAIRYEVQHGTIHSVRAAFEHAVSASPSRSAPGLWKLYIFFCGETPQFQPQAKDIWHRALRACPWAKELYTVGFEQLNDLMSFAELKKTWRVMGEKDLRVHADLEERFEDLEEAEQEAKSQRRLGYK